MAEKEYRLYIKVTPEFDEKFSGWAKRVGLTKSQFGNLCIQAGLNALITAVSPAESFTPEMLVGIIQAAEKKGVQLDLTDFKGAKVG